MISVFDLPLVTIGNTGVAAMDAGEFLLGVGAAFADSEVVGELPGFPNRLVILGFPSYGLDTPLSIDTFLSFGGW